MSFNSFDNSLYAVGYLYSIFGLELVITKMNLFYTLCSLQVWAQRDPYPLRIIFMSIFLVLSASAAIATMIEFVQLWRQRLPPKKLLQCEIYKTLIWITWSWLVGLCLSEISEQYHSSVRTFVYLSCVVHGVIAALFISPLVYASVKYHQDRTGQLGDTDLQGWRYEGGKWLPGPGIEGDDNETEKP